MPDLVSAAHVVRAALGERHVTDRAALETFQSERAQRHLAWVLARSPYTAARFMAHDLPLSRWRELPVIGKAEMMANFDGLNTMGVRLADALDVARRAEDTRDFTPLLRTRFGEVTVGLSTGTSGSQGVFLADRRDKLAWAGVVLRHALPRWSGDVARRHRVAFFLRAEGGLYRSVENPRLAFEFFDMLQPVPALAARVVAFAPTILVGPPSVLRAVAEAGGATAVRRVISVAEVLEEDDRRILEAAFGPVVEIYQATEGVLGLPCREGNLHLNEQHVHVELDPLGDGRFAPIVTDLSRRAQPMVRHRLDDVLHVADSCPCGSAMRRIVRIEGRCDDALRFGESPLWPDFVRAALVKVPGLDDYCVSQIAPDGLELAVAPDCDTVWGLAADHLRGVVARHAPGAAAPSIRRVPMPPVGGTKKRRRVSNRMEGAR